MRSKMDELTKSLLLGEQTNTEVALKRYMSSVRNSDD